MTRLMMLGAFLVAGYAFTAEQASAQYYVPNFVTQVPLQSPVIYYNAPRAPAVYYPRNFYPRQNRFYPSDFRRFGGNPYYAPGTTVYNIYGPRRVRQVPTNSSSSQSNSNQSQSTNNGFPRGVHPSHYFGNPAASHYFPR